MITITINSNVEGVWKDFTFRGQPIRIKVRPRINSKVKEIREKNCKTSMVLNTLRNSMEQVEIYDEGKILSGIYDWIIEDIEGIALRDQAGKDLPLDESAKLQILNTSLPADNLVVRLIDEANALAVAVSAGQEEEAKN